MVIATNFNAGMPKCKRHITNTHKVRLVKKTWLDAAYGKTNFKTEAERVAFLFELYQKYTSLFTPEKPKRRKV